MPWRRWGAFHSSAAVLITTVLSLPITAAAQTPPVRFEDVSGLLAFERYSRTFGGSGLGGAAWFDYDNDGDADLFLTNGKTQPNALFRNNGDGTFTDVAAFAGVDSGSGSSGVVAADVDNDGYQDLFVTGDGGVLGTAQSPSALYHNNGDGTFANIIEASGIVAPATALSAVMGDVDGDGFLDLFITAPGSLSARVQHRNRLFRNNGDLTFTDISQTAGVDTMNGACAALFSDYDNDADVDLFIADCNELNYLPTPVELFRNNGDLTFTDVTLSAGLSAGGYWMGFAPADYDRDGDIDLFVTNLGTATVFPFPNALYENRCEAGFVDVGRSAGVAGKPFGWGCTAADFDNDGRTDVFFAGSLPDGPLDVIGPGRANPGSILFNTQRDIFADWSDSLPVNLEDRFTSGVASADYDNDGFVDVLVVVDSYGGSTGGHAARGAPVLLRNLGNENRSITLQLVGTAGNRDAVGARVQVTAGASTQTREVYAGSSFLSMDSQRLVFGLGRLDATERIRVRWATGIVETFPNADAGTFVTLVEGRGVVTGEELHRACDEQATGRPLPQCGEGVLLTTPLVLLTFCRGRRSPFRRAREAPGLKRGMPSCALRSF